MRRCEEKSGDLLDHVSSANTARDLDLLRKAVGDKKLTYHGISYGTHLGAIYANMFPDKVRALAFDGALDFIGNATGHGDQGTTVPLVTRQDVPRGVAELIEPAQARWRAVNAPQLVALVRVGARFENGKLVERPDEHAPPAAA